MRIFWISEFEKGDIGMMARPRGNEWLADEIKKLKHLKVDMLVSLLEWEEIKELAIEGEKELCMSHQIEFISFPIPDRGVPKNTADFVQLVSELLDKLRDEKRIVVHCRMGIGRTALLCAAILLKNGFRQSDVFDLLSRKRTLNVPDTDEQAKWVHGLFA